MWIYNSLVVVRDDKTYKDKFKPLEVIFPRWLEDVGFYNVRHDLRSANPWKVKICRSVPQQEPGSGDCGVFILIITMYLMFGLILNFSSGHGQYFRKKIAVDIFNSDIAVEDIVAPIFLLSTSSLTEGIMSSGRRPDDGASIGGLTLIGRISSGTSQSTMSPTGSTGCAFVVYHIIDVILVDLVLLDVIPVKLPPMMVSDLALYGAGVCTEAVIKLPGNVTIPAVIVFGDSIVDAGNNNNLKTPAKCNFPPYGRDFMGGVSTGRFSNGKVPSDLIAEELGIKELLPAYLQPNLQPEDLLTGVTFASGGCGYDPLTTELALQLFKEYTEKVKQMVGEEGQNRIMKTAFVLVVAGSNDIDNTYFASRVRKLQYDISAYTDLIVGLASTFFKELYGLGVRRMGVFSAPPLGCLPSSRTLGGGKTRDCANDYNEAAQMFNTKLSAELDSLNIQFPDARLLLIDIYNPLLYLIQNPIKYGFEVVNKGCCGTGTLEASIFCNQFSLNTCTNVSGYIFWDGYHPTERTYKILVSSLINKIANGFVCAGSPC
ncbi:GDSL esterase/lipase EXL3 [Citrus sinensis]|nr:GDSL esterase/lipase EXL3 [Citrus sinensis]